MNREAIGHLIGLRYKLMWAKTRTRGGRIALFVLGYVFFVLIAVTLAAGGVGAGVAAVKSGHANLVAYATLTAFFMSAIMWTLLLGFGMNNLFSETELRRYPLTASDRRIVSFCVGFIDPFWALILLLDLGLVVGLYIFGTASLGLGALAVLLLLASNFILARTLGMLIDRLSETPMGSSALLLGIMGLSMAPSLLLPVLRRNHALREQVLEVMRYTPPFAAADAITAPGAAAWYGLLLTAVWLGVFLMAMIWVERHRFQSERVVKAAGWDSRFERIGALFGESNAALVGFWLRFYTRNSRVRTLYFASVPLAGFLAFSLTRPTGGVEKWFLGALGGMPVMGYFGTSRIAVNQFGYTGGGFRRFFLLPADPGASLRAASYAAVLLGLGVMPIGLVAFFLLAPGGNDPRKVFMLLCYGLAGVLIFNGLGLWTTLYGARKGSYTTAIGNDLSLAGNVVVIGCMLGGMLLPTLLHQKIPAVVSPDNWPWAVIPAGVAYAFYRLSMAFAAPLVVSRREELMRVVEGKA